MPIGNPGNEIGEEWTPVHAIRKCANGDIQLLVEKGSLSNPGKKKSILGKLKKMFSVDTNFQGKEINRALGNPSGLSYKVAKIPGSKKYAIYHKSDKPSKTNWVTGPFNTSSEALQYYTSWDYPSYPSRSKKGKEINRALGNPYDERQKAYNKWQKARAEYQETYQ